MGKNTFSIRFLIIRVCLTTVIAFLFGVLAGIGTVFAEINTGLNIPNVGNRGVSSTNGYFNSPSYFAIGTTETNPITTINYIRAHIRVWHGGSIRTEHNVTCNNCSSKSTQQINWVVYESAITRSDFRGVPGGNLATYVTSYIVEGCTFTHWNSGGTCPP